MTQVPSATAPPPRRREGEAPAETVEDIEVRLLLEGVYRLYGYDFRDYAATSMRRRVRHFLREERLSSISLLQDRVLHDASTLQRLVGFLTVHVTAMFRDPEFYRVLRHRVLPMLRTYPMVRVWHAGCSTGEEVYSLAILLREMGLYDRCRIYATDVSDDALRRAQAGSFPLAAMRDNTTNYLAAGGQASFSQLYKVQGEQAVFLPLLRKNVVFAQHNLVTDRSFNEFNLILCRNVLIYFNKTLQERVHRLLYESLGRFGFLALGSKETVSFTPHEAHYESLGEHVFRKVA